MSAASEAEAADAAGNAARTGSVAGRASEVSGWVSPGSAARAAAVRDDGSAVEASRPAEAGGLSRGRSRDGDGLCDEVTVEVEVLGASGNAAAESAALGASNAATAVGGPSDDGAEGGVVARPRDDTA